METGTRTGEYKGMKYSVTVEVTLYKRLANEYGTYYGTVYLVRVLKSTGHPETGHLAVNEARDLIGRGSGIFDQRIFKLA